MIDLDFRTIRNHDSSQDAGFEELICQLAHLEMPENAKRFIRKDGAGGDAGVECFWILEQGDEIAWQAKYFLEPLTTNQWNEISNSVETALEKHPKLVKYYVCIPRDLNDSRKLSSKGNPVTSSLDIWNSNIAKWQQLAKSRNMNVEFILWGKHEISLRLQRDIPQFAGRARYWFGKPILTNENFKRIYDISRTSLGERYTPENNVTLPIFETLKVFAEPAELKKIVKQHMEKWIQIFDKNYPAIQRNVPAERLNEITFDKIFQNLRTKKLELIQNIFDNVYVESFIYELNNFHKIVDEYYDLVRNLKIMPTKDLDYEVSTAISNIFNNNIEFISFFKSKDFQLSSINVLLVEGEAGIGKSHLLCDLAINRISSNLPTIFILGQHYEGNHPLITLKRLMDLNDLSDADFLAAFDAAGEAHDCNALIIIDAINEGKNRDDWINYLTLLKTEISKFPNIKLIISCRATYIDWLIPDEIIIDNINRITHPGFKGLEHKAAETYMNNQGISKPSVPILSPEFSNPLFLKTCCKAIKEQGLNGFPKGLTGITSLLEFYLASLESTIIRIKHYIKNDGIMKKVTRAFAEQLYPNNLFGLPLEEARDFINSFDYRHDSNNSLFDLLLHEGFIAEDLMYNTQTHTLDIPVIRFTYERFSDYFIALSLIEDINIDELKDSFESKGKLNILINENSFNYRGILNALGVIIPEKYSVELINLLPKDLNILNVFDEAFFETLLWRSPAAFNEETLDAFNKIQSYGRSDRRIDVLIALSTEPDHPWNAEMLHRNLISKSMPERDKFWSIPIAVSDYKDYETGEETNLRALIDWAYLSNLKDVEVERVRLCLIILIWITSTSNRFVRDQATKSAVRLLTNNPELTIKLLDKFKDVNDFYVLERLYAITYGSLTNQENGSILIEVVNWVWLNEFKDRSPKNHLLLRDYARGIMEYGYFKGLLPNHINIEYCRPPYQSNWSFEPISRKDLEKDIGKEYSSIKSSVLSGDFGRYTMSNLTHWSSSPIESELPKNVYELQKEFAKDYLEGELQKDFVDYIESKYNSDIQPLDFIGFQLNIVSFDYSEHEVNEPSELDILKERINKVIDNETKEYFKWLMTFNRSTEIATFNLTWAQNWVCRRAFELGWTEELFDEFERNDITYNGRMEHRVERIGKKYQWIALFEFLALMSDNFKFIDPGYTDADYSQYYGPWQLSKRDLDPTFLPRNSNRLPWDEKEVTSWWQQFDFNLQGGDLSELTSWLWSQDNLPNFKDSLIVKDSENEEWIVLNTFVNWKHDAEEDLKDEIPSQDVWYRINSCIIKKNQVNKFKREIGKRQLVSPDILKPSVISEAYFREYPWHPIYKDMIEDKTDFDYDNEWKMPYHVPVNKYDWEKDGRDFSIDESVSLFLPSKKIIDGLGLIPDLKNGNQWLSKAQKIVFFDPSIKEKGNSCALIHKNSFFNWLEENDLQLIWLIGGEKQLFTYMATKFFGRLIYSGFYNLDSKGINGIIWFDREEPEI